MPSSDKFAGDFPSGHHRRVTVRVTARSTYRLRAIVEQVAAELDSWPYIRLVGCELGRYRDHSLRSDLGAWLTYEIPPSASSWVKSSDIEQRAFAWVEGPSDLRGYENIRVVGEVTRATRSANPV